MSWESVLNMIRHHTGKTIGILLGLIFGILVLSIGFWRSVFLVICVSIGYGLGNIIDKKEKFVSFLERILPIGPK